MLKYTIAAWNYLFDYEHVLFNSISVSVSDMFHVL